MDKAFSRGRIETSYQQVSADEIEPKIEAAPPYATEDISGVNIKDVEAREHTPFATSTDVRLQDHKTEPSVTITALGGSFARPESKESVFCKLWRHEIAGICIALIAFCAILGLVSPYQELKAAPDWPYEISINTVISIISVVLRAGLLVALAETLSQQKWNWFKKDRKMIDMATLDQASRGPWGSILLLYRLSRASFVTYLGAVSIILTVAIGPFAQQLVRFTACSLPSSDKVAGLPRQSIITPFSNTTDLALPSSLQSAILAAVYAPEVNLLSFDCPSGSCLFLEPFYTAGYCSICQDMSDQLNVSNSVSNVALMSGISDQRNTTNFTLPSGSQLTSNIYTNSTQYNGPNLAVFAISDHAKAFRDYLASETDQYPDVERLRDSTYQIISRTSLLNNCNDAQRKDPKFSWQCRGYGAAECTFQPCVQTRNANVTNGKLSETLLNSTSVWASNNGSDATGTDGSYGMVHSPCLSDEQRQKIKLNESNASSDDEWLPYTTIFGPYENYTGVAPVECIFQMDLDAVFAIDLALDVLLNGTTASEDILEEASASYLNNTSADDGSPINTTPWIQASIRNKMYNDGNTSLGYIENLFASISAGITAELRQIHLDVPDYNSSGASIVGYKNLSEAAPASTKPAQGIVLESGTCVQVRWGWLAYPAVVILLTIFFVACVAIDTSLAPPAGIDPAGVHGRLPGQSLLAHPAGSWKSSVLPFMFHVLGDSSLRSRDEMKHEARRTTVKLVAAGDGWKLRKSHN